MAWRLQNACRAVGSGRTWPGRNKPSPRGVHFPQLKRKAKSWTRTLVYRGPMCRCRGLPAEAQAGRRGVGLGWNTASSSKAVTTVPAARDLSGPTRTSGHKALPTAASTRTPTLQACIAVATPEGPLRGDSPGAPTRGGGGHRVRSRWSTSSGSRWWSRPPKPPKYWRHRSYTCCTEGEAALQ